MSLTSVRQDISSDYAMSLTKQTSSGETSDENLKDVFGKIIDEKTEEFREKLARGETEKSYPIGGASYTFSQWKKLIDAFDDIEEDLRRKCEKSVWEKAQIDDDDDEEEKRWYVTCIDANGIRCKRQGEDGLLWEIPFTGPEQYRMAMSIMDLLGELSNPSIVSKKDFWEDVFDGKLQLEDIKNALADDFSLLESRYTKKR